MSATLTVPAGAAEVYLLQVDDSGTAIEGASAQAIPVPPGATAFSVGPPALRAPYDPDNQWDVLGWWAAAAFLAALLLVALILIWKLARERLNVEGLISEMNPGPDGTRKASLARFQALLFTFVFLVGVLLIVVRSGDFPRAIDLNLLLLLTGSLGTYLASKYLSGTVGGRPVTAADGTSALVAGTMLRAQPADGQDDFTIPVAAVTPLTQGVGHFVIAGAPVAEASKRVVAVAVDKVTLELRARYVDGRAAPPQGCVFYRDEQGATFSQAFSGTFRLTTPAKRITEVAVGFTADDRAPVRLDIETA